ncbi:kinase-like domain-containing protein, partial [Mycena vulgaris]
MPLRLHDLSDCTFSSCKLNVWQWFKTAVFDYDRDTVQDLLGCCANCVLRALSDVAGSQVQREPSSEEPAIWPVILWAAFQAQRQDWPPDFKSKSIDTFIAMIESPAEEHIADEETLSRHLIIPDDINFSWTRLEASTRQSSRPRLFPREYDTAISIGAVLLWASSNSTAGSPELSSLATLSRFLPGQRAFLRCLLERRLSLERNRVQLQRSILHDPDSPPFLHVVEMVYMVYHLPRALPQHFLAVIFTCILKFSDDKQSDEFRAWLNTLRTWDNTTCLINFRSVLATTFKFSQSIEDQDLPKPLVNVAIHTDIRCICAQFADIFRDPTAYREFLKARDDHAQKLLDLLQDVLDYPLLDVHIRPILLKALLKLSATSGQHPRCFVLSDMQLIGHQVAAGSFGDVWKGTVLDETVSVKVMRVLQEADVQTLLKEFYHEALIWRQLSHSNLLPFFGVYYLEETRTRLCLVSPWMEKGNIARYLRDNPTANRLTSVVDIALRLEYLHSMNVVHGDLKAINVLAAPSGRAILADFGLSSVAGSKILLLSTSSVKNGGTVRWQAPELFMSGAQNSFVSDVYAFSCVCYEIFTGRVPFQELTNDMAVMFQVIQGSRPTR